MPDVKQVAHLKENEDFSCWNSLGGGKKCNTLCPECKESGPKHCPKCRTIDYSSCHSMRCPMRAELHSSKVIDDLIEEVKKEPIELLEMIAKVHDSAEGRYDLTGQDLYEIQSFLCELQEPKDSQSYIESLREEKCEECNGPLEYWTNEYVEDLHIKIKELEIKLAQRDERIKQLELILSGKTFFDEKEVMQLRIDELEAKLAESNEQVELALNAARIFETKYKHRDLMIDELINPKNIDYKNEFYEYGKSLGISVNDLQRLKLFARDGKLSSKEEEH